MTEEVRPPIELRESNVSAVKFAQRIIELIAVPYNEEALVEFRSEIWHESFEPGSFNGIEKRPNRVRVNRDHDEHRLVGKAVKFWPSRTEGLVAELRISQTPLGDETLALADDDVLGASVGYAAYGRDQVFDRKTHKRRIMKAFLDHITLTPKPAYLGAGVLSLREGVQPVNAASLPRLNTPELDELIAWQRARKR